jgi:carboxyl-terminal processing protease
MGVPTRSDVKRTCLVAPWIVVLGLLALGRPHAALAEPFAAGQELDGGRIAAVTTAALSFIPPRALFETSASELALWGMQGLTALDPRLVTRLSGKPGTGRVVMDFSKRELLAFAAPAEADAAGWGRTIAAITRSAWDVSETVRRARTDGILAAIFDEMFAHFDPYTRYTPPQTAQRDRMQRGGRAGPGLDVAERNSAFVVVRLDPQGPAALAGVRLGDVLLAVDDQSLEGADIAAVHALLAGPRDSTVVLTLRRATGAGGGREQTLVVARSSAPPATVFSRRLGDLLVLRIQGFADDTAARLSQELIRAMDDPHPPRGIVLDLRGNRGGVLSSAVDAAAALIGQGVVARTDGRAPAARRILRAEGRDLAHGLPVAVLVDGDTASAAEVFAAALADDRRAVVIGTATLGKGLVQTVERMPDGGELYLTWSRILAPRGWPLQDLGVVPQVCSSLGPSALMRQLRALRQGTDTFRQGAMAAREARPPLPPARALALRAPCPAATSDGGEIAAASALLADMPAYEAALLPAPSPAPVLHR